jgi:molybdate transport system ATP-binding protein
MTARLSIALHAVSVRRGDKWVLKDISLRLKAGERWALLGGNGAGKTQLLKLIATNVWPTPTGREALIYRAGRAQVDRIEAKRRIAYIGAELQDKYARYAWNPDVRDLLATGLHRTDLLLSTVTEEERERIAAMLELCGLSALAQRKFLSLSYGQKRIALLARALVQDPDWLLLDEFYNGLDNDYRRRMNAILEHARRRGQSWVVSAHRAADVPEGTGSVMDLRAGRLHSIKSLSEQHLTRLAKHADEATVAFPLLAPPPINARLGRTRSSGRWLVRIARADLYVDYGMVLKNLNWELRAGEHWAVFGANGAGKSSFLKLLYGDLSPALGGLIERRGIARGTPIAAWKRRIGLVSPELQTDYAVNVSVFDLVASGRYASIGLSAAPTRSDQRDAHRWLKFFKLVSVARRQPRELSYGQLRRALFARALAANPRVLLLDEPLTGLDPRQRATMKRMLEQLMQRRITLIMAVHHPEDLPRGITHSLHLHERRAAARDLRSATEVHRKAPRLRNTLR